MALAYLNGDFVPLEDARVPVLDRGFLFGDGVYEVIPAYGGRPFRLPQHLARLRDSLEAIGMQPPLDDAAWAEVLQTLVDRNGEGDQSLYLQVTRGVAPRRDHAFPQDAAPTVFAMSSPIPAPDPVVVEQGVAAITLPDIRWQYCHIKAITLLPAVLMRQEAQARGAVEAILIRDGLATEGAASNLFAVLDGVLVTPPKGPTLLPGITRDLVLELARDHGVNWREADIPLEELGRADEVWLTSSTREIVPVTRLDDQPVGDGRPGPVFRKMYAHYQDYKAQLRRDG